MGTGKKKQEEVSENNGKDDRAFKKHFKEKVKKVKMIR